MKFSTTLLPFRPLLASLGLVLAAAPAWAQTPASRYPATSLGLTAGYGGPYGWGGEASFMVLPRLDVNAGLGFSITGAKLGVGTRYYFAPERKVSPFVGGNLVYSSGFSHLNINTSGQSRYTGYGYGGYYGSPSYVLVNFKRTALLHLRGGGRWQPIRRFALLGVVGYGTVLGPDAVEYVDGNPSQSDRNLVDLLSPGGVELSVGVAFGLVSSY